MRDDQGHLALASGGLILLGVALFALQPGPPEPVCATDPNATSGFTDPEQDCPISIDSMNAIRDHEIGAEAGTAWRGVAVASVGRLRNRCRHLAHVGSPHRE